jgi:hypothetical protein
MAILLLSMLVSMLLSLPAPPVLLEVIPPGMRSLLPLPMQAAPGASSKKDEDGSYDLEAAALAGSGTAFKPLAGVVRSLPPPFG